MFFVKIVKINSFNSVTVVIDAYDLCKDESGKVAIAYTVSMTLNPQAVTVNQLLFMLNTYLRPNQTKDKRYKKILVTQFQNFYPSKRDRSPQNSDTLMEAGMVDGSIVIVKTASKGLKKEAGWKLDVGAGS